MDVMGNLVLSLKKPCVVGRLIIRFQIQYLFVSALIGIKIGFSIWSDAFADVKHCEMAIRWRDRNLVVALTGLIVTHIPSSERPNGLKSVIGVTAGGMSKRKKQKRASAAGLGRAIQGGCLV